MNRRQTVLAGASLFGMLAGLRLARPVAAGTDGERFAVTKSDAAWRSELTSEEYAILRGHGTERAGSSPLAHEERDGRFACAGCAQPLFSSAAKFESGTGWPSFTAPLPDAVGTTTDTAYGMRRTEVHCARCGGHLGHLFADGPRPTGLRYCMNGAAMRFVAA